MKEIFPSSNNKKSNLSPNEQAITNQQYADLVRRTNEAVCCATAACQCVSDFNSNPNLNKAGVITATSICGTTQVASNLVYSNYATVNCRLCAGNIDIDGTHHIRPNEVSLAGITSDECISTIQGVDFQNGQIGASFISADDARITDIEIENKACISCADIYKGSVCNADITTAEIANLSVECGLVCNLDVTNLNADTLSANCFTPSSIETEEITAETADFQNITHLSNPQYITQELADTGDYWILLPIFTNGNFFIQANNDGEKRLWSTEITNSLKNIQIRWSQDAYNYIKDFKIAEDARGASVLQIHANLNNETAKLYHQSISTSNTDQLAIYSTDQLPDAEAFNVNKLTGTWIQDIIFTNTLNVKNLEMDNVAVDCVTICKQLRLTCDYEDQGGIDVPVVTAGTCNQYVQNKDLGHGVAPTWVTPANIVQNCNEAFIMSCDIANYNGAAKSADAGTYTSYNVESAISSENWEYDSENGYYINPHTNIYYSSDGATYDNVIGAGYDEEEHAFYVNAENTHVDVDNLSTKFYEYNEGTDFYPITHLGDETCVHGDAEIECSLSVGNNTTVSHALTSCCFNDSDLDKHVTDGITNVKAPNMEYCFIQCACGDGWYPGSCVWNRGFVSGNMVRYLPKSPYTKLYACIEGTLHGPFDMLCTPYSTTDGKIVYCGYYNCELTESAFWCAPRVSSQYVWACWYCLDEAWTKQPEFLRAKDGKYNRLAVYSNASLTDKCPVIYDAVDDSIKTTDNLGVSCANINCLTAGRAYICELHAVTEIQEQSTSDYLTLRTNNATSLTNEQQSGLLVNNYDGSHMAGVVVDCEGILRVGDGTKDNDIYPSIYYNTVDGKWYKDAACTIEEDVIGTLTAWDSREEIDDVIHYTNAVFTTVIWQELSNTYYKAHQKDDPVGGVVAFTPITQCRDCGQTMVDECVEFFINGIDRCEYTTSARIGHHPTVGPVIEVCGAWRAYTLSQWCFRAADIPVIDTCNTLPVFDPSEVSVYDCPLIISRYSNAVDSLEPLLTRDEVNCMNNQGLIFWDCTGNKAKTLPLPTCDEQVLTACISGATTGYRWQDKQAGNYTFASMACYEAYAATHNIPENSTINIENEETYLKVEEEF